MAAGISCLSTKVDDGASRAYLLGNSEEQSLVKSAKLGQHAAFEKLCSRYTGRLMVTVQRITRSREDAEDALQDCLLSAYLSIDRFDGRSSFATWLTRIAINSALMILRKRRSIRELPILEHAFDSEVSPIWEISDCAPNPEKRYLQKERQEIVRQAVGRLRPRIQRVVELNELQECSMKATAETLGISVAAAKGRLFHGRLALRKSLRKSAAFGTSMTRLRRSPNLPNMQAA
jgi:RNA polymerase sigma-70 factor (ECF subfamily)